jgi:hypothetical protein
MRKVIQKAMNQLAKRAIAWRVPEAVAEVTSYSQKSGTTGTQWITLWMAIDSILKYKPEWILEAGTGSSTVALAATVKQLRRKHPSYKGSIVSMESLPEWHELAIKNLPNKYDDIVEIVLGPRTKFEAAMFRGYYHSNIPIHDYSFVLIDGPAFQDENGISFCADIFKAMEMSSSPKIHGVSDGRASSVFVIQQIYGAHIAPYWHGLYATRFTLPKINLQDAALRTPKDFSTSILGKLEFVKFRRR